MQNIKEAVGDRENLPIKIVQFGEGNFLRAFVNWVVQEMNDQLSFKAGVSVVQPIDKGLAKILAEQNGLYTLYLNGIKNGEPVKEHQVISCIQQAMNPYEDYEVFLSLAEEEELEFIVSNTTEAGIAIDDRDQHLTASIHHTFPAKLTAFLYRRFKKFGDEPATGLMIMPCELINKNGEKLKEAVATYASRWQLDEDFMHWLNTANTFANTLVDRIVPGYPKDKMEAITDELGYTDNLVVEGEQFHLWVIEGPEQIRKRFPADKAGLNVVFTGDLQPYRERKVRILNGAHTSMVPLGLLMGIETVKEAVEHPELGSFVREIIEEEIIPTLSLSEEELSSFASSVLDRFKNPFIKHYLSSIALNSLSKFGTRVLPTIAKYIEIKGTCPDRLCTAFAGLIAFYRGIWGSQDLPVQDNQQWQQDMSALWTQYDNGESTLADLVKTCLGYTEIWSEDLNTWPGLAHEVTQKLEVLTKYDVRKLLSVDDAISDVS